MKNNNKNNDILKKRLKSNSKRLLYIDCKGGISGDMFLASCIDLGVPVEIIVNAAKSLPLTGFNIKVTSKKVNSIAAKRFIVEVNENHQPHRSHKEIKSMILDSSLAADIKNTSIDIFETIAIAEAAIHDKDVNEVHFHEVGAVDSIVDITGAAAAISYLGAEVVSSAVPTGCGFINQAHGVLPVPAPATMKILNGVPSYGTDIESELTTPTGAAIVKTLATSFGPMPPFTPISSGLGTGERTHEKRPGLLRTVLGEVNEDSCCHMENSCIVLEANIDDMSGELAGNAIEQLISKSALDAWIEPIHMKKGRPAFKICVLCRPEKFDAAASDLLNQTTTIGLRYYPVGRIEMKSRFENVETPWGAVKIKISEGPGGEKNVSPEFSDCKRISTENNIPIKEVMAKAQELAGGN